LRLSVAELHRGGSNGCSKLELTEESVILHVLLFAGLRALESEHLRGFDASDSSVGLEDVREIHVELLLQLRVVVLERDNLVNFAQDSEREAIAKE